MDIISKIKSGRLYFDGGFGTMLQSHGLKAGQAPEIWNITNPEIITNIHYDYLLSGANIISTNTLGASRWSYIGKEAQSYGVEEIVSAAFRCAKDAIERIENKEDKFIALDIGPTGKLLKPFGDLDFEDAIEHFAKVVKLGVKYGADLIIIETFADSYETKAAVLAAKENSELPVFVTNAYDKSGKLVTGATASAMVAMLEGLKVDALGINCSLGPEQMLPVIKEIVENSSTAIIVNPNAGLPVIKDGKTTFDVDAEEFSDIMVKIAEMGVNILGGCCGTTPLYIKKTKEKTKDIAFNKVLIKENTVISSYTHSVEIGKKPILIGERINPTGKSVFKNELKNNKIDYILKEGIAQQELGADILDVNVGIPGIDEKSALVRAIKELQSICNLPLQIDTADYNAVEAAMRIYNGKPLINSVSGKKESMEKIFPLAAKYGGVIITLTLDETGIPETVQGRIEIAERIINTAKQYGIHKKDIIVDPLAMAVSADSSGAITTLKCIEELSKKGIKTSLGVSNVSFGLPKRAVINSVFFSLSLGAGLSAAIMNPHSKEMMDVYYAHCALMGYDTQLKNYIEYAKENADVQKEKIEKDTEVSQKEQLRRAICSGITKEAAACAKKLLKKEQPLFVINECIIPALDEIGAAFEKKTAFLPQLLMSAEAAKGAFDEIKLKLSNNNEKRQKKYKIIIATVRGDIHDIGKNIVKTLLENYDYDVIDLGKDVPCELIVETAIKEEAVLVCLSALMTTTVPAMEETIALIRKKAPNCRVAVGGAVLTQEYADMIGADMYGKDAMETVRYAESLLKN